MSNEQNEFDQFFDKAYNEKKVDYNKVVNIALVGNVSSGKSSILNAFFQLPRNEARAKVGVLSGVTTEISSYSFGDKVFVIDCPGLSDIRNNNSAVTQKFLSHIDLGLFVVTGSADASQKANLDDLKKSCDNVLVILNKIDQFDEYHPSELENIKEQWCKQLGIEKIYGCCAKGYDPKMKEPVNMDIRGIDEVREEVLKFLKEKKKDILLMKEMKNKQQHAIGIISAALVAVSIEAFIPGSAAYITATQITAITALHYLYTGEVLSKSSAIALLPTFIARSAGMNLFLFVKSFIPMTGILDVAGALIAVTITFAMLASVMSILKNGNSLDDKEGLQKLFLHFKNIAISLKDLDISDIQNKNAISDIISKILK